jgi:hypothetical protein
MWQQHRKGLTAGRTKVALNPLLERPLRIRIPLVTSMAVDHPRRTTGTRRTQSFELIFAKLDRRLSPKSSRPIKPLSPELPASTPSALPPTVQPHARTLNRSATTMAACTVTPAEVYDWRRALRHPWRWYPPMVDPIALNATQVEDVHRPREGISLAATGSSDRQVGCSVPPQNSFACASVLLRPPRRCE